MKKRAFSLQLTLYHASHAVTYFDDTPYWSRRGAKKTLAAFKTPGVRPAIEVLIPGSD